MISVHPPPSLVYFQGHFESGNTNLHWIVMLVYHRAASNFGGKSLFCLIWIVEDYSAFQRRCHIGYSNLRFVWAKDRLGLDYLALTGSGYGCSD